MATNGSKSCECMVLVEQVHVSCMLLNYLSVCKMSNRMRVVVYFDLQYSPSIVL